MNNYPIVYIPDNFQLPPDLPYQVENNEVSKKLGRKPKRPSKPIKKEKPTFPGIKGLDMLLVYSIIGSFFGGFLYLLGGSDILEMWPILLIPFVAIILTADEFRETLVTVIKSIFNWSKEYKTYKDRLSQYNSSITNHQQNLNTFNKKQLEYKQKTNRYFAERKKLTQSKEWQKYIDGQIRKSVLEKFSKYYKKNRYDLDHFDITKLKPKLSDRYTNEGFSESFFYNYLILLFDENRIITQHSVGIYYPDFIIATENQFNLDIEIDEPYAFETREPIHYYFDDTDIVADEIRNKFFKDHGWVVIRFTEKQILTQPESCCAEIIRVCKELYIPFNENCEVDIDLDISIEKMPSYNECLEAEKNKTREKLHSLI
ncbi:endonuclease domain-containing protein [Rhodohalobacter barkolensis]|uniref:DUF559 domain-containing protein n=1 Tax=Rhodohalobacter barkolensis TaxID=2053187 RepID=A0A2N0VHP8_9BACT|nr:hypothetical protein [Rhodohalobacter barkolensis]PKD43710.1 hypothetical protein CWD77_09120 [Rhodohalobacter barkolensis]